MTCALELLIGYTKSLSRIIKNGNYHSLWSRSLFLLQHKWTNAVIGQKGSWLQNFGAETGFRGVLFTDHFEPKEKKINR